MVDPLPNYIQLVTGLTKATRARARSAARSVLSQVGLDEVADDASERITKLTEEIQAAGKANREMLENLITTEVERAAARLGFARKDDVESVRAEVAVLRTMIQLQTQGSAATSATTSARKASAAKAPAKKAAVTKVAGAAAKRSAADRTSAQPTLTPHSPAEDTATTTTSTEPGPPA